jgi:hypothetical protein
MRYKIAEIIKEEFKKYVTQGDDIADNVYLWESFPTFCSNRILALFPDLSDYEVEIENKIIKPLDIHDKYVCTATFNVGTIRIPLAQFIAEGRSEGKVIKI